MNPVDISRWFLRWVYFNARASRTGISLSWSMDGGLAHPSPKCIHAAPGVSSTGLLGLIWWKKTPQKNRNARFTRKKWWIRHVSIFLGLLTCPCSDFCPKWWVLSPSKDPCIVTSSARKSLVRLWTPWIFHQIWVVIAVYKPNKFSQFLPTNPSVAEFSNPLSFLDKFGRFAPPPWGPTMRGAPMLGSIQLRSRKRKVPQLCHYTRSNR